VCNPTEALGIGRIASDYDYLANPDSYPHNVTLLAVVLCIGTRVANQVSIQTTKPFPFQEQKRRGI
jgi:hypothetical protein